MVEPVCAGIRSEQIEAFAQPIEDVTWDAMLNAEGIVVGNPTRFGGMDWQLKRLFDETAYQGYPGPLAGKVGGAFGAGSRPGSGSELALLSTLHVLLNHGMIIQGNAFGPHYGPVFTREISQETMTEECFKWGALWARLVKQVRPQTGG